MACDKSDAHGNQLINTISKIIRIYKMILNYRLVWGCTHPTQIYYETVKTTNLF